MQKRRLEECYSNDTNGQVKRTTNWLEKALRTSQNIDKIEVPGKSLENLIAEKS